MYRGRMRRPHRGAVRSLLAVSCGPACTIPSPVSDPAATDFRLVGGNGEEGAVIDRFDKSISERVERSAQGADILCDWNMLLRLRDHGAIVDNRTAGDLVGAAIDCHRGIDEVAVDIPMADAQLP